MCAEAARNKQDQNAGQDRLFGVYVHWPFCASKCPYCDFNSHVRDSIDEAAWREAYRREIEYYASLTPGRRVTSVFFGGGTPSLMSPETAASVIESVRANWVVAPDVEITLEANPTSVEASKFKAFREAGVNRVSIGVQALDDGDLKFLGRQHSVREALAAVETAAQNFERFSFDLIYARPGMSVDKWRKELAEALKYARGHMSLYQLTIEEGTPFYMRHARGDFSIPDDDGAGDLYEVTQEIMAAAGMPAYEISNHAGAGHESRHNLTYWRYEDYVGVGPGAHGRLTMNGQKVGTRGHRAPEIWLERVGAKGHGSHDFEGIGEEQGFMEALMMGLRLSEGMALCDKSARWRDFIDERKIGTLQEQGFVEFHPDTTLLRPMRGGMQRLNSLLSYILKG